MFFSSSSPRTMACFALFRRKKRTGPIQRSRRPSVTQRLAAGRFDTQRGPAVLPAEVVLLIFHFASADSPSTACTIARLCSQTRDRVRNALYTEPTLTTARQINLFLRTVKRAPELARRVRGLRLDGGWARRDEENGARTALTTRLAKVLELCSALEALELRRVVVFSLTDFANARQLRHLAIVDSLLSDRTTTSRFTPFFTPLPSLQTLTLRNIQLDGPTASHFLSPHTLPRVTALSLENCRLVDDPATLRDLGAYSPSDLAGQLEVLRLTSAPLSADEHAQQGVVDPYDLVERCTSLRSLAVPVGAITARMLEWTEVRPARLAILPPPPGTSDPFEPHLAAAQALSTTFLRLAAASSTSAPSSPGGSASPLALALGASLPRSRSALPTPAASRVPSPTVDAPSLVAGLAELILPRSWDRARRDAWRGNGEFAWAVGRIARESMVWVVEGTLSSEPQDDAEVFPHPTQHYLRPSRLYRVGRAGGVRAPPKAGQTKPGPASRHRPYDFRIASLGVSKEGLATFETGGDDWDPVDNPDKPGNAEPYPLAVSFGKKVVLTRADGEVLDPAPERVDVKDGDLFKDKSRGYWFRFTWRPVNLCFAAASAQAKKEHAVAAKALGIKVAYRDFRAHHTHLLTKLAAPSTSLTLAAMHRARIVAPVWWDALLAAGAAPPAPPAGDVPPHPGPEGDDKALAKWEKDLLELERDVGADYARWWGHCVLERDWAAAWPDEAAFVPAKWGEQDPRRWAIPREERATVFEGVLVVSLRGNAESDALHAELVTLGGGAFFPCPFLQQSPLPSSSALLESIASFKSSTGLAAASSKIALFPPEGVLDAPQTDDDDLLVGQRELVGQLRRALGVKELCSPDGRDLATAIYDVSAKPLLEGGADEGGASQLAAEDAGAEAGPSSARRTQTTQQAQTQATPPFPTGGVPGTHPDSGMPAPSASASGAASAGASQEDESGSAPSQPRKLTRRARTGRTVLDSLFDDLPSEAQAQQPLTQGTSGAAYGDLPSGTLDSTAGSAVASGSGSRAMELDAPAPTATGRVRRRAGRSAVDLLLGAGSDSPERDGAEGTQSMHEELMRTKKTRQERLRAIEEEDQRLARLEGEASQKEKEKEREKGGKRRRAGSASASDGDGDGDGQPRKRAAKKGGEAPLATTKKRTRAQSREPTAAASSSGEDEEGARRAARKKSKAPASPSATAAAPKNKKEALAAKKAEKEAREREAARLLQLKPTKRKGAEADAQFTEEFNALKIVRPALKPMPAQEHRRMRWEEEDSDAERERLVLEDQEHAADEDDEMDPDHWRRPTQAMFVIRTLDVERKERAQPRTDGEGDERWAGRPNFKKFRPKNSKTPRQPLAQRPQVELTIPDHADFGLGPGYSDRKGTAFSQVQQADDEDDEDDLVAAMTTTKGQTKLTFGKKGAAASKSKAKAPAKATKGKGKAKQVVESSEDDDDDTPGSSRTLRGDDDMDFDELDDDDDDDAPSQRSSSRGGGREPAAAAAAPKRPAARKAVQTIMIDDSDSDSDSGLTFKGFGKKAATGRTRR
ncbi:hypothetical protein JCM10450v2_002336 [Rhodotorula kratochvilovae]